MKQEKLLAIHWENLGETEYEVMAIVDIPGSMTDMTFPVNGVQAVIPQTGCRTGYGQLVLWYFL